MQYASPERLCAMRGVSLSLFQDFEDPRLDSSVSLSQDGRRYFFVDTLFFSPPELGSMALRCPALRHEPAILSRIRAAAVFAQHRRVCSRNADCTSHTTPSILRHS